MGKFGCSLAVHSIKLSEQARLISKELAIFILRNKNPDFCLQSSHYNCKFA